MKVLLPLVGALILISTAAFADFSQMNTILNNPQLQAALPSQGLLSLTVKQRESQRCVANYLVNAKYSAQSCTLSVWVDNCSSGASIVEPANCVNVNNESLAEPILNSAMGSVSFERDIRPVFQKKCTMCHGAGKARPADYSLFSTALANKAAINQRVVIKKDMPMGVSMDQKTRDLVAAWIQGGAGK